VKKAWRVSLMGHSGITASLTRGKAIALMYAAAIEAGYRVKFTDAKAIRAPEYDAWAGQVDRNCCYAEHAVKSMIQARK